MVHAFVLASFVTQLSGAVEASTSYNNATFLLHQPGEKDKLLADGIYTVRVGFTALAESDRTRHYAEYRAGYQGFVDQSAQNSQEHRGELASEVDASDRWTLRLADRFLYGSANTVMELGAPVFVGQQLGATSGTTLQSGQSNFFENAVRLNADYNADERWVAQPEVGYEIFYPLDVFGRQELPINHVLYERFRLQRGFQRTRIFLREEQSVLIPPENRAKQGLSTLTVGIGHNWVDEFETRAEVGGTLAENFDSGDSRPAPYVALSAIYRTERHQLGLDAGFENTVNVEFGGLTDVYFVDYSELWRPNDTLSFEAATGWRRQMFLANGARSSVQVDTIDAWYAMVGSFYHLNEEVTFFSRAFYRNQETDYRADAMDAMGRLPPDITYSRIVIAAGLRVEWPRVSQRRIRH